jgi:hypothetical protein
MNSNFLTLNTKDFLKGLLVAVISAALTLIYTTIQAGSLNFDWKTIGITALTTGIAYIIKNVFQNSTGTLGQGSDPLLGVNKTSVILLFLIFACNIGHAQTGPWSHFWQSKNAITIKSPLKSAYGDVTVAPTSVWAFKLDATVGLVTYQYVGGLQGYKIGKANMAGVGVSYQKVSQVNGQNWANLTFKALFEIPTVANQEVGACVGVYVWDARLGLNVGYILGEKYPFLGLGGSWNF